MAKIYVTKYVVSGSILVGEEENRNERLNDMVAVKCRGGLNGVALFHGKDWYENEADAQARAKKMIEAKLKSLDKQRAGLVKMLEADVPLKDINMPETEQ